MQVGRDVGVKKFKGLCIFQEDDKNINFKLCLKCLLKFQRYTRNSKLNKNVKTSTRVKLNNLIFNKFESTRSKSKIKK